MTLVTSDIAGRIGCFTLSGITKVGAHAARFESQEAVAQLGFICLFSELL